MQPFTTLIDTAELAKAVQDPHCCVFDCRFDLANTQRGVLDYALGHIPGAFYAHLDNHLSSPITPHTGRHPLPDVAALKTWLGHCGVGHETQVVVYDDCGGAMAVRLWWLLRWLGHTSVALLDGGWQAWQAAALPIDTDTHAGHGERPFEGEPNDALLLTTDEILADLETGHWRLIDARTEVRFRGEQEPIDPVAGRIPGSVNLPLQLNLADDGRFKSASALRELYAPVLQGHAPDKTACLCGSGVTACHNLLAMAVAGYTDVRLYAGSWSEWIRDPKRPVASG